MANNAKPRRILIGVAWPYANGYQHLGHLAGAYLPPDLLVGGERSRVVVVCSQGVATEAGIPRAAMLSHGGWSGADACRYLECLWSRTLAGRERAWALEINELVEGLPLAWVLLAPLLDDPGGWEDVLAGLRVAPIRPTQTALVHV